MSERRVFDSHFHIFDFEKRAGYPNQNPSHGFPSEQQAKINRTHSAEEAEETLQKAGILEGVFVQCYNDCPEEVEWVQSQAQDRSFIKGIVGGLDIGNLEKLKKYVDTFKQMERPKFVGVRHLIDFEADDYLTRKEVLAGLKVLSDNGLTFDLQSYPQTIKHIPLVATTLPKLKMVIDHIAKPHYHNKAEFQQWCDDMTSAAEYQNVFCKLSGLINEIPDWSTEKFKPYVDHCLKVFGPKRCMYGSDWPVCMLATPQIQYRDVIVLLDNLVSQCTEQEKDDIFYNNAKLFYNLQ